MAPVTKRDQPGEPAGLAQQGDPAVLGTRKGRAPSSEYGVPSTKYRVPSTEYRSASSEYRAASSEQRAASSGSAVPAVVLVLRPRAVDDLLRGQRRRSFAGAGRVAAGDQARVQRHRCAARYSLGPAVRDLLFVPRHSTRRLGRSVEPPQRARVVVRALERGDGRVRLGAELWNAVRGTRLHGDR